MLESIYLHMLDLTYVNDVLHLHSRWYQDVPSKGALTLGKPRWGSLSDKK
jgi:hypothetical protein